MNLLTGNMKVAIAVAMVAGAAVVTTWAQGLGQAGAGSLAELTAEVRQLKVVIQEAGRSQNQMQALNISLMAQQSRLAQVSARLDTAEEDLQQAMSRTQEAVTVITTAQNDIRPNSTVEERAQHAEMIKLFRQQADAAQARENTMRVRRDDLMNAFRAEEARWLELVARLEEVIKR
jgi:DNA repair exonuclease SbcCD ATPase subunit